MRTCGSASNNDNVFLNNFRNLRMGGVESGADDTYIG